MRYLHSSAVLLVIASWLLPSSRAAAQTGSAPATEQTTPAVSDAVKGGTIHGHVKSGSAPIPGVSITATNTLTGKKYTTTTDITGAFSMSIPQNGRYVLKSDLAAFAATTKEALLNASSHEQTVDFDIVLASRAQQQANQEEARSARQYSGSGAQSLNLANALSGALDATAGGNSPAAGAGAQLPTAAGNSDFANNDSVAISGQSGVTSPFADINRDQIRDEIENRMHQDSLSQIPGQGGGGGGGMMGGPGGGPGGGGMMMMGGPGGGRMPNFRKFRPDQPHGAFFWNGGNSALNALPYALRGQQAQQTAYNSNHYGLTLMGEPFLPGLTKPSGKDTIFLTLSGQKTSTPYDQYATVPTVAERGGDFSGLLHNGAVTTIYDPQTSQPFSQNLIPQQRITAQAAALLNYLPLPNLNSSTQNYHRLTTQQTNSTTVGLRYMRTIGQGGGQRLPAFLAQFSNQKGLRQNVNANFNYSHSASDRVTIFPEFGGKTASDSYSLQLGYSIGWGKLTNNFTVGWNRSDGHTYNLFTNKQDIATQLGILGYSGEAINSNSLNYGFPNIVLSQFSGMSETQPSFQIQQTISFSESSSWRHGKHNLRFGGDYRRIHLDLLSSSNATGTFYFTGYATEAPSTATSSTTTSGSAFADLLLGMPQETSIQAPLQKAYTRANAWDLFAQDDYRVRSNLTLMYGIRYEYFSPYSEKYDDMSVLDHNDGFTAVSAVLPNGTGTYSGAKYPHSLLYPFRLGFAPRVGFAFRPIKDTVIRGGYGINYTNGQYSTILKSLLYQSPFAKVQTNLATSGADITLARGFTNENTIGNYSINPHYKLPYVQVWNLDVQRTLPMGIMLNIGYNGAKGTHLDITTAPGRTATTSISGVFFNYEDALAYSNFNALTIRARKRLQKGVSLGATYTYSHGIDNAGSIGGTSTVVAQDWTNLRAEEGNSSFDQRHKINGDYMFELPFGPDKKFLNSGSWLSHAVSDILVTSSFGFATGTPLTPSYAAAVSDVARGTAGSLRPNRNASQSITAGGGSLNRWFNPAAFSDPASGSYGTASRNSIPGPGTVSNDLSLSKNVQLGDTRSFEMRATATNVFNTVQYSSVDTNIDSNTAGYVTSAKSMRQFNFMARFRF